MIMSFAIILLFINLFFLDSKTTFCLAKYNKNVTLDCVPKERKALLSFRASLRDPFNRLSSWDHNDNHSCCTWSGVVCDKATGHVTGLDLKDASLYKYDSTLISETIDSSLLGLKHLSYLDLSGNDFQHIRISTFLGNLSSLRTLDLSGSSLVVDDLTWATNLSSLEYLDMSHLYLNRKIDLIKVLYVLPSLVVLRLSNTKIGYNNLVHATSFLNSTLLANVEYLDLSNNHIEGELPCFLRNMTSLSYLDLSHNMFNFSTAPQTFSRSKNLAYFNLAFNPLNQNAYWISQFLWDKCHLKTLNLRGNNLYGDISGAFKNLSGCWSHNLESIDLWQNEFYGHLPDNVGQYLKHLQVLDVSYNKLSGVIPSSIGNLRALRSLSLHHNQMSGEIPISLGQLSNLERIDISYNTFEGTLLEAHFAKLSNIQHLDARVNMLEMRVGHDWVPPFQLKYLSLGSNEIRGQYFPKWLETQKSLITLDLSDCSITGTLPKWLSSLMNLTELNLSNNHIEGPIPDLSSTMTTLQLSNNMINGSVPDSLCEMENLDVLDICRNRLSGYLPDCWGNKENLRFLRVSSNNLKGSMPKSIGGTGYCALVLLQLNNNRLTGQLPSLRNCTFLKLVDVGDNKLFGKLPELPRLFGHNSLKFIRLRNNKLYGDIPSSYCYGLSQLQIMDLADNMLTGSIPQCFSNFSGMVKRIFDPTAGLSPIHPFNNPGLSEVMKGAMREYTNNLRYVFNLDLSSNHLMGEIPSELIILTGLIGLNLSHNHLEGRIPENIGDMQGLISLDLSNNNLLGTIPQSLSKLNFLSHLNVSNNNLSGHIPTGSQLQTLNDPSSYEGNPRLCGDPLLKKCHVENETPKKGDGSDTVEKIYLYALIITGVATGFWGYFGVLFFKRSWRLVLFQHMDTVIDKLLGRY